VCIQNIDIYADTDNRKIHLRKLVGQAGQQGGNENLVKIQAATPPPSFSYLFLLDEEKLCIFVVVKICS
jgi:hypothetical protein